MYVMVLVCNGMMGNIYIFFFVNLILWLNSRNACVSMKSFLEAEYSIFYFFCGGGGGLCDAAIVFEVLAHNKSLQMICC